MPNPSNLCCFYAENMQFSFNFRDIIFNKYAQYATNMHNMQQIMQKICVIWENMKKYTTHMHNTQKYA